MWSNKFEAVIARGFRSRQTITVLGGFTPSGTLGRVFADAIPIFELEITRTRGWNVGDA
jgi:hypothetical protein